jgi:hypothetical protein
MLQQAKLIIAYDALKHLLDIFHQTTTGLDFVRDTCSGESVIARHFNLKRNSVILPYIEQFFNTRS